MWRSLSLKTLLPGHPLRKLLVVLAVFCCVPVAPMAWAAEVTLSWNANTESDLAGYRVFSRKEGALYDYDDPAWEGTQTACTISGLDPNTLYYFVVRAYDTSGNESSDSDEVSYDTSQTYSLVVSTAADRSDPVSLEDETVSGDIYVFITPNNGIDQVSFYLDDPDRNGSPVQVEDLVEYDFAGTDGDGSARPFDTTQLSNGGHQVTALIALATGSSQIANAAFTVQNGASPILTALSITGASSVNEGATSSYTATATYSDGSTQDVSAGASWSENSAYATISSAGVLSAASVSSNQTVTITAGYTDGGVTRNDQFTVTIVNTSPTLSALSITGASSVNEGTTSSYTATATYSDGSTQDVSAGASWSENSAYATISSAGVLSAASVSSNQTVTITAGYTDGGVTRNDQFTVTIVDVPPSLTSLTIGGAASVNENSTSGYTATATYSDGSTQTVTSDATWSENASCTQISSEGVLTTSEVTRDTPVTITATYSSSGITRTAQKTVTVTDIPEDNLPPNTPVISSPYDGQMDCDPMISITVEDFSDPNGDAHGASEWQIAADSGFSSTILNVTTADHLTQITVPHAVLSADTTYYVRVRFYDVYLAGSEWSSAVEFTTAQDNRDSNDDGIPDDQEVGYGVDLDQNGVDDIDEPENIRSVQSSDGTITLGIAKESDTVSSIDAVEWIDPSSISSAEDRPDTFAFGMFAYRITVNAVGAAAQITVYYPQSIPDEMTFYKYDTLNGWQDYSAHTTLNGDGRSITLAIKDGGYGDSDGEANGVIVDPGGLGGSDAGVTTSSATAGAGPSGGGCFIATLDGNSNQEERTSNPPLSAIHIFGILVCLAMVRLIRGGTGIRGNTRAD